MRDQTIIGGFDLRDRAIRQQGDNIEAMAKQQIAITTMLNRFVGLSFKERMGWLFLGPKWLERRWMQEILLKKAAAEAQRLADANPAGQPN